MMTSLMKRLLLVTTSYPDLHQGQAAAGIFVQDFATELTRQGIAVEVVAPSESTGLHVEAGVKVRRFAVPKQPLSLLNPRFPGDWATITQTLASGSRAVLQACDAARPDHILALWALPSGHWARQAARRHGTSYSTWSLGSDVWTLARIPLVRGHLRRVLRAADHRFADGYGLAADVEKIAGLPCEFLTSSRHLPARAPRQWRGAGPYRLSYLGRWHPNKGVDLLLDALDLLDDEAWLEIESVRIFGGGQLIDRVHDQAARLVAAGRPVEVGGYLEREGAIRLLEESDFLLLPSRIESIPVVFSDAMQMRCPIVATPVGDLPRLLETEPVGELAKTVSAIAFANAICKILGKQPQGFEIGLTRAADAFRVEPAAAHLIERLFGSKGST
ncbi:Glycosyl transferase group 1 [Thiocapsa sp. KS1]|nr:glycosyltransferase family 4 protein [Thiocapsa sp. KS1]CRI66646.1 Glycosyl transferase group 1 [Thiocapsa sp. KS1]